MHLQVWLRRLWLGGERRRCPGRLAHLHTRIAARQSSWALTVLAGCRILAGGRLSRVAWTRQAGLISRLSLDAAHCKARLKSLLAAQPLHNFIHRLPVRPSLVQVLKVKPFSARPIVAALFCIACGIFPEPLATVRAVPGQPLTHDACPHGEPARTRPAQKLRTKTKAHRPLKASTISI